MQTVARFQAHRGGVEQETLQQKLLTRLHRIAHCQTLAGQAIR